MLSGFIHKQKLLQKPTDNCEQGISSGVKKHQMGSGKVTLAFFSITLSSGILGGGIQCYAHKKMKH